MTLEQKGEKQGRAYTNFIGIDMAKETFVVAFFGKDKVKPRDNNAKGFKKFRKEYDLTDALVIMEFTGGYAKSLCHFTGV